MNSVATSIGKVHDDPQRLGTAVWSFKAGALTRLSVETDGTKGRTFVLTISDDLKSCNFQVTEVGQVGGGAKSWINTKGKKRWLIALQTQSTTCRISG